MNCRRRLLSGLLAFAAAAALSHPARAWQGLGTAILTAPVEGQVVAGLLTIAGTATHPQFLRYELHFSFEPNPTDAWFAIQDPSFAPVTDATLGAWDTTKIADGLYVLRLRVVGQDGNTTDAFVRNIAIRNTPPTQTPPPTETLEPTAVSVPLEGETPAPGATETAALIILPPTSTPRSSPTPGLAGAAGSDEAGGLDISPAQFGQAFCSGVYWTFGAFALLGAYAAVRAALRPSGRRQIEEFINSLRG